MVESPATRASLLIRIRDPQDAQAWEQFIQLYSSMVYGFLRRRGLQDADAADLMQDVMRSVASAAGRLEYDPERGSFRSWMFTITRNKLNTFLSRQHRQVRGSGDTQSHAVLEQQTSVTDEDHWDQEYQRGVFSWAVEQVREHFGDTVWQAFWQTAVEGKPPKEVASALGMSVGAVYVAKSRVIAQMKSQIEQLEAAE